MSVHHFFIALTLMFLCGQLSVVSSNVIYITTSAEEHNNNCRAKPCITLPHLAANLTNYLSNNVSIVFLQGKHHLDRKLQFMNISTLLITTHATYSHSNSTVWNTSIICSENASFEFDHIDSISLSNFNFTGCEHKVQSAGILIIEQSSFYGKNYSGSAIELVESTAFILRCSLISNSNGNYLGPIEILRNTDPPQTAFTKAGGALIATQSKVNIIDSVFANNSAVVGGAIFTWRNSSITILNSTFCYNSASKQGVHVKCSGGAVYFEGDDYNTHGNRSFMTIHSTLFIRNHNVHYGEALAIISGLTSIVNSYFLQNVAVHGGSIMAINAIILTDSSQFESNIAGSGGAGVACGKTHFSITDSVFTLNAAQSGGGALLVYNNIAKTDDGGVLLVDYYSILNVNMSHFIHNYCYGRDSFGGVIETNRSIVTIYHSQFYNNGAETVGGEGGVVASHTSTHIRIEGCQFVNNYAHEAAGVLLLQNYSSAIILGSTFENNSVSSIGGVIVIMDQSSLTIDRSQFYGNQAQVVGAIDIGDCESVFICNSMFSENYANEGGVIRLSGSKMVLIADITLVYNYGSLFLYNSVVHFTEENYITDNMSPQNGIAGAIMAFHSEIVVDQGTLCLMRNSAGKGGGIYAKASTVRISNATVIISNNVAKNNGGGLYFYLGEINCLKNCILRITNNTASEKGGGIYAVSSSTKAYYYYDRDWRYTRPMIYINENVAEKGGGICLEENANIYVLKYAFKLEEKVMFLGYGFYFMANRADYGGAVYIADETSVKTCDSNYHSGPPTPFGNDNSSECSIQVLSLESAPIQFDYSICFQENFAYKSGSTIFGGLFDRCTPSHYAEIYKTFNFTLPNNGNIDGTTYLQYISNINLGSVTSLPVRLCFCDNGQQNCSYQHPGMQVKKGETFTVSLVAVDQVNHTVPNASVHSYLLSPYSSLHEGRFQVTNEYCTELTFSITSSFAYEQVTMYPEGPCKDALVSQSIIDVQFLECTCPAGFQKNFAYNMKCVCECDTKIFPEYISDCDPTTKTVTRKPKCWIGFINDTKNSTGYLIYSYCPSDYCLPSSTKLNLNVANGSDAQCANSRRGLLCGACKNGLSLSLGSSHCLWCTKWSSNFAITLTTSFLVGIAMVAIILMIKLTVASGTLSGIIFYANIVNASSTTFLPFASPNIITVAISWLNLEFGIDVCFFNGMDAYWKAWIELIFPAYLIFLVVLVIYMCKYFNKFAWLIAGKNPVATLATLILLSYTKILRTIITSLSFAILYYPDHSYQLMWLSDATVKYLRGKHIALFLAAVLILIVGTVYTLLLLTWQWIHGSKYRVLKWIDHLKFDHFIEAYNAPYTSKHRYWTGLLLLVRVILYMVVSINVSNDPATNMLAVAVVVSILLLLKICLKVYKNKWHNYLEIACFFNINLLSLASLYFLESERNQTFIAYISGSVTLALLVVIFIYHTYKEIVLKLRNKLCRCRAGAHQIVQPYPSAAIDDNDYLTTTLAAPTSSVIDAPTPQAEQPITDMFKTKVQKEKCENPNLPQDSESDADEQQLLLPK